jgi:osmotically inducible protein OsmC
MKRFGSAAWNGGLREGKGSVSTESRALETYPYTFFSRYGEKPGTNPEELLGAAHAACFKACAHAAHQRNWYILNRGDWRCRL